MRLSTLAALLLGLAVVFWAPAAKAHCPHGGDDTHEHCGGAPATSNEFRFTGFTDETFNGLPDTIEGGQGMLAMHALCQDDFGPDSRMCTSEEFWLSPNADAPAADAWMHPGLMGGNDPSADGTDFSGISTGAGNLACNGWGSVSNFGLTVTALGKPAARACNIDRPVTCCAPIQ